MTEFVLDKYKIQSILIGGLFFAFLGETGCGKTASMTWFCYWIHKRLREIGLISKTKIYVNYHLKDYPKDNFYWDYVFLNHPDMMLEIKEGFIFGDEIWGWCLDSYETRTKAQKKYDKLMGRGRKRGLSIFASSQRFMRIEPNFRFNVHYLVFPELIFNNDYPEKIIVDVVNNHTDELEGNFSITGLPFLFQLYDTREEIKHLDEIKMYDYDKLAKEFNEWNKMDFVTQNNQLVTIPQKVTQPLVNLFLQEQQKFKDMTREERKMLYVAIIRKMYRKKPK